MNPFTIVLIEPQIPPNTGNIARLCAANNTNLHLVGSLGFQLDNRYLKRAGLDYWEYVNWQYFPNTFEYFQNMIPDQIHLLTTKVKKSYTTCTFQSGDYLIFGSETNGIPQKYLDQYLDRTCTIPMLNAGVRSLNLSTSVGIVLYEAFRQITVKF